MNSAQRLLEKALTLVEEVFHPHSPLSGIRQSLDPNIGGYEVHIGDEVVSHMDGTTIVFRDGSELNYADFYRVIEKIDYSVHIPKNYTGD